MDAVLRFFSPCPRGLEPVLASELAALGASSISPLAGGVSFEGDRATGYRANLHSRIASRVMLRLAAGRYRDDDGLYRLAAQLPWEALVSVRETLRVDLSAIRSPLRSLNFATLRIKDAIVDRLREKTGQRPSIDTRSPGTRVFGFLEEREATLYLDWSGEPLFKRGWRSARDDKGEAPLKENLAAGLVALSGWSPDRPFYDPFCGSGTIAIEAAQAAAQVAPGVSRAFGFERLPDHDAALWVGLRADAIRGAQRAGERLRREPPSIAASDVDPRALRQTRANLARAGLDEAWLKLSCVDLAHARAPFETPGFIVANPPYGERIAVAGEHAAQGMRAFADTLKQRFGGWTVCLLSSDRELPRALGLRERRKTPLYNGPIECRLFTFEIRAAESRRVALAPGAPDNQETAT